MVTVAYKIIFLADVMFTVDWRAALLYRLTPFRRVGDPSAVNTLGMICGLNVVCSPPSLPPSFSVAVGSNYTRNKLGGGGGKTNLQG